MKARFYAIRLVKGGAKCPLKVWYGPPHDPVTGEELDRSPRWQALRNGTLVPVEWVMTEMCPLMEEPIVVGERITEAEYTYLLKLNKWSEKNAPASPEAALRTPVDLTAIPSIF